MITEPHSGERYGLDASIEVYAHYTVGDDETEQFLLANTGHCATPWAVFVRWSESMPFRLWHYETNIEGAQRYLRQCLEVARRRQHVDEAVQHFSAKYQPDRHHELFGLFA